MTKYIKMHNINLTNHYLKNMHGVRSIDKFSIDKKIGQ